MAATVADDNFKCIFLNENDRIPILFSLKFVPGSPIDIESALVQAGLALGFQVPLLWNLEICHNWPKKQHKMGVDTSNVSSPWCPVPSPFLLGDLVNANPGSGNGLAPNRWQAITSTNADPVHWRIYAALGEMCSSVDAYTGPHPNNHWVSRFFF